MDNHNDRRAQQRLQLLLRYRQALDVGDLATIAAVLRLAEDDPGLESMLLELDSISQAEDGDTASADQLQLARGFLNTLRAETQHETQNWNLDGSSSSPQLVHPQGYSTNQEGQVQLMQQEPSPLPPSTGGIRMREPRRTRSV